MDDKPRQSGMRKTTGWLLFVFGILWAVTVLMVNQRQGVDISSTLGAVTVPILVALVGLYFAGIIKSAK
jgi:hypothetical protein